jgi:opine dehydrogenase
MQISVIGGGHGCYAAAVELSEKGHSVKLWRRDTDALRCLKDSGGLEVTDHAGIRLIGLGGQADLLQVAETLREAVDHAELLVVALPATTHDSLAEEMAELFKDGQVVFFPPGTLGSLVFANAMRQAGNTHQVAFAETGTLPYLARKHGENRLTISGYATRLPTGVFPAKLSNLAFSKLREAYPAVEPAGDALSGALMNAGPIIHPPLILMNAGPLEHFAAWDIHNEGTVPSIRRVTDQLDAERIAIRNALGYSAPHFPLADHYAPDGDEWMYGRSAHVKATDSGDWREKIDLQSHRYMLEDTALGLSFLVSIGKWAGVQTPLARGLLSIAEAVCGVDLYQSGRTLESLGLAGLDRQEMARLLNEGWH